MKTSREVVGLVVLMAAAWLPGCAKKASAPAAAAVGQVEGQATVLVAAKSFPLMEDFEEEAATQITPTTLDAELAKLAKLDTLDKSKRNVVKAAKSKVVRAREADVDVQADLQQQLDSDSALRRTTRADRRRAHDAELRDRYQDVLLVDGFIEEMRLHAENAARLDRVKRLGRATMRTDVVDQVWTLRLQERARHAGVIRMLRAKKRGSEPPLTRTSNEPSRLASRAPNTRASPDRCPV
ncbi:MAG: hypothetical protein MUF34_34460 [Polyangiaceae bacterium]|nr:hypothetical protein [Polyangiaceae bacterium]